MLGLLGEGWGLYGFGLGVFVLGLYRFNFECCFGLFVGCGSSLVLMFVLRWGGFLYGVGLVWDLVLGLFGIWVCLLRLVFELVDW